MGGQYGTQQLEKIAADAAGLLNAGFKGGIPALFGVLATLNDLRSVNFTQAGAELKELDGDDRAKVEAAFKGALDLPNKDVEAKIGEGLACVDDGFALASEVVDVYHDAVALEEKVKKVVGL